MEGGMEGGREGKAHLGIDEASVRAVLGAALSFPPPSMHLPLGPIHLLHHPVLQRVQEDAGHP